MFINYSRSYTDHSTSVEKWSSFLHLAHKWQFETIAQAAFKAYVALSDVKPVDKITMGQKYDRSNIELVKVYMEICMRRQPLSLEEAEKVGLVTLTIIAQTREEIQYRGSVLSSDIIANNLVQRQPCYYYQEHDYP